MNPYVGGAAAEIAVHRQIDIVVAWGRLGLQQRDRRHDLPRLTIAALRHIDRLPGGADGVGFWAGNPLDGGDCAVGATLRVNIGTAAPTFVGMDAVLDSEPSLSINGVPITAEEARRLLQESEGLALIKNKWVVVDTAKLQQTLEAYEKVRTLLEDGGLTLREALALQLSLTKQLGDEHVLA